MLTVQLARSVEDFDTRVGPHRDDLRSSLRLDFAFIAAYWLVFATTSALFATRGFRGADWLGAVAGEVATIGALADVSENVYTLRLLRRLDGAAGDDALPSLAWSMRVSSLVKWTALFAATGLLSTMFFVRGGWSTLVGIAYALPAGLGLAALASEASRLNIPPRTFERVLRVAFLGQGIALMVGLPIAVSQF